MKATQTASRSGPEPLARQHHARPAEQRHAQTLHRRAVGDRADLEPDDLRSRHQEQRRLRRRDPRGAGEEGKSGESLFFDLALEDLTRAADLFRPVYDRTNGVDGWVSLEVSPLLAHDTASTIAAAKELSARAGRPNLFIKIPGTKEGLPAIEEAIFAGVPINVTLLFSREQYVAAAEAYLRGIERRIAAGLNPQVGSVASMFISRWDVAVAGKVPEALINRLGIAIAGRIYKAYLRPVEQRRAGSARSMPAPGRNACCGPAPAPRIPRPPTSSTSRRWPSPFTVNTMPEATLKALADHGEIGPIMAAGRRRLRSGPGPVCQGRHQLGCPGRRNFRTRVQSRS